MECGLVGGGVVLGIGFGVSKAYKRPSLTLSTCCLLPGWEVSVLLQHHVYLPACHHDPCCDGHGLSLVNCKQAPTECFLGCIVYGVSFQQYNSN